MRKFSTAVQTIINSGVVDFFYLMELNFNSNYYFTTAPFDIPYASFTSLPRNSDIVAGESWVSDGGIFQVDTPKFNNVVDREQYKVTLVDINNQMLSEIDSNVVGSPIKVWLCFYDASGNALLNTSDIISVYSGFVDSPAVQNDWESKLASFEGTSPMSDLDRVNSFITSKSGMDNISSTDTSFDDIYLDTALHIKWGKT